MTWSHRAPWRPAAWLAPLLLLPVLAGCGQPTGHVSGKVTYNGQPLPGGRLTFRPADPTKNSVPAVIDADGHYEVTLPAGEVTVAVDNRELQPAERGSGPRPGLPPGVQLPPGGIKAAAENPAAQSGKLAGKYVPISDKFYEAETSGLKYSIKSGSQTQDIELK